jgi:hypothetical protein
MTHSIKEYLEYCPTSGIITWKKQASSSARVGAKAGCRANGYIQVRFMGKLHYAHRLAYLLMMDKFPDGEIDHINGKRSDNRWDNLRVVTSTENQRNTAQSKNNTSGVTGVCWDKRKNKWMAKIQVDRRYLFLGYFTEIAEAASARKAAEEKYGFHPNHGRKAA